MKKIMQSILVASLVLIGGIKLAEAQATGFHKTVSTSYTDLARNNVYSVNGATVFVSSSSSDGEFQFYSYGVTTGGTGSVVTTTRGTTKSIQLPGLRYQGDLIDLRGRTTSSSHTVIGTFTTN